MFSVVIHIQKHFKNLKTTVSILIIEIVYFYSFCNKTFRLNRSSSLRQELFFCYVQCGAPILNVTKCLSEIIYEFAEAFQSLLANNDT